MKKLWNKIKNINFDLRVLLIILILLINFLLLFKPEVFKNKTSYITVKAKKQQLEDINNNIIKGTNSNTDMTMQVADLREQDADLEKRAMVNRKEVDPNGLEFHLPSILIRLEDSSKANGLSISIKYSEIAYQDIQGKEIDLDSSDDGKEDEAELDDNLNLESDDSSKDLSRNVLLSQKGKDSLAIHEDGYTNIADKQLDNINDQLKEIDKLDDSKDGESKNKDSDGEVDDVESDMIEENKERFKEEGVEVTQIPIEVKGTYAGVKKFIKDLDKLNYLEPTKVEIKSLGQTVEATITISIFHGDIFR